MPDGTPARAAAAARTLDLRGPRATGWSPAWRINLRAPADWPIGHVTGLRARGGVGVDITWTTDGAEAVLTADHDQERGVRYGDQRITVALSAGTPYRVKLG